MQCNNMSRMEQFKQIVTYFLDEQWRKYVIVIICNNMMLCYIRMKMMKIDRLKE